MMDIGTEGDLLRLVPEPVRDKLVAELMVGGLHASHGVYLGPSGEGHLSDFLSSLERDWRGWADIVHGNQSRET